MKIFAAFLMAAVLTMTAMAADASGKWSGTFAPQGQDTGTAYLVLTQSGTTLTGSAGPDANQQWPISNGKAQGGKLTGTVTSPDGAVYKFNLTLQEDRISGDIEVTAGGQTLKAVLDVKRVKS